MGKPNYNPFFVLGEVSALRSAVKRGVVTEDLWNTILKLQLNLWFLDPTYKEPVVATVKQNINPVRK